MSEVVTGEDYSQQRIFSESPGGKSFGDEDGFAELRRSMDQNPLRGFSVLGVGCWVLGVR